MRSCLSQCGYFLLALLLISHTVIAANDPEKEPGWGGSVQAGGVMNTGNSDNTNLNGSVGIHYHQDQWHLGSNLEGEFNTSDGDTTAENITFTSEGRYAFTERDFFFAKGGVTYDRFSSFDLVIQEAIGYGRVLYRDDKTTLILEGGPGGRHSRISGSHEYQQQFIVNMDGTLKRKLTDNTDFTQTVAVDFGDKNTHTKSVSAIKTKMSKNLALQISYTVQHDSKIPANSKNIKKTDTTTKIAVVYDF